MDRCIFLTLFKEKDSLFSGNRYYAFNDIPVAIIKPKLRSLKKVKKQFPATTVVLEKDCIQHPLFRNTTVPVHEFSYKTLLPVLNQICRQITERFAVCTPLEEIIVIAPPAVACEIIFALRKLSRLFTVVSKTEGNREQYDELYFRYGTPIRQQPRMPAQPAACSIIINLEKNTDFAAYCVPVLNLACVDCIGCKVINARDIYLSDVNIAHYAKLLGLRSGVILYEILGIAPEKNTVSDINNSADSIFLLDTTRI